MCCDGGVGGYFYPEALGDCESGEVVEGVVVFVDFPGVLAVGGVEGVDVLVGAVDGGEDVFYA